jgi:hypothetical protein
MPLNPALCSPCSPYWLRELLYWPPAGEVPDCCLLLEDDSGTLLLEDGSGCLAPENC